MAPLLSLVVTGPLSFVYGVKAGYCVLYNLSSTWFGEYRICSDSLIANRQHIDGCK